ncbi:hypothetical protein TSOC_011463 [Tetrabaena socialis]|uniref:CSC1/OSCA1-like 7TM region domain-containing protein n=1 Tax=Tetrabaena socialis TaxID=47790 RepID=A0A2J7ZQJ7_9CHLO|nr:hypothetical protein TSOC_011463 [Tetrabaena socialis]|eukprot:PNH02545.1 hypothetical protein TSOC_011463 [Tetrabaena socialis]
MPFGDSVSEDEGEGEGEGGGGQERSTLGLPRSTSVAYRYAAASGCGAGHTSGGGGLDALVAVRQLPPPAYLTRLGSRRLSALDRGNPPNRLGAPHGRISGSAGPPPLSLRRQSLPPDAQLQSRPLDSGDGAAAEQAPRDRPGRLETVKSGVPQDALLPVLNGRPSLAREQRSQSFTGGVGGGRRPVAEATAAPYGSGDPASAAAAADALAAAAVAAAAAAMRKSLSESDIQLDVAGTPPPPTPLSPPPAGGGGAAGWGRHPDLEAGLLDPESTRTAAGSAEVSAQLRPPTTALMSRSAPDPTSRGSVPGGLYDSGACSEEAGSAGSLDPEAALLRWWEDGALTLRRGAASTPATPASRVHGVARGSGSSRWGGGGGWGGGDGGRPPPPASPPASRAAQVSRQAHSLSQADRCIAKYMFYFAVFNVFLGGVVGSAIIQGINSAITKGPSEIFNLAGQYLPTSSNFFINYTMFRALVAVPLRLLWPHIGVRMYLLRRYLRCSCVVTSRERAFLNAPVSPRYGFEVGMSEWGLGWGWGWAGLR